jgi:hypothetical protein
MFLTLHVKLSSLFSFIIDEPLKLGNMQLKLSFVLTQRVYLRIYGWHLVSFLTQIR